MIQTAWIMPGRNPRIVSRILSQKCGLIPTVKKTPSGGKMMANIIRRISMSRVDFYVNLDFSFISRIMYKKISNFINVEI
jgi:hypothetical protein